MNSTMADPVCCRLRRAVRIGVGIFSLVLLILAIPKVGSAEIAGRSPRVLILYPYDERLPATSVAGERARTRLLEATAGKIDLFSEFLDMSRFRDKDHIANMARFLAQKYAPARPDVLIALGEEAINFIVANRAAIAPDAQIVFAGIGSDLAADLHLPDDVIGALTEFDITNTFALARNLQPDARQLVVMAGSGPFDKAWLEAARRDLPAVAPNYKTTYLTGLTIDEFADRAAKLPSDVILLVLTIFKDSSGQNFIPRVALEQVAKGSSVPTYGPYSTYIGHGIVGGSGVTFESMGEAVAGLALDALAGKPITDVVVPQTYVADIRQLERWGLQESSLPEGTVVSFKDKSLWEEHQLEIIAVVAVLVLQGLIISALLVERSRRRAAEVESRRRLLEVAHLNQSATAGALSASIAHELNQPLGAIRNNTAAAEIILGQETPDLDLIRQILADIRDDDQRASDIIQRLRGLLKKRGDIDWQEFDINEVVKGALHILHGEAERRSVLVDFAQTARQLFVRADRVHVQQVILNLATNAMDAMQDTNPAQRRLVLQTALSPGSKVAVSISDTGNGIPSEQLLRVFETFFTTKSQGTGLGLSIARTLVETYGGKIWADNHPEGGAVVSFVLPLAQPR
jgi:signal transduction histidine kinase